jgi:hypothetical protein
MYNVGVAITRAIMARWRRIDGIIILSSPIEEMPLLRVLLFKRLISFLLGVW